MPHLPGFVVYDRNIWGHGGAHEIDISLFNHQARSGLPSFPDVVLVECKNWNDKVDAASVAWFDWKLRLGGAKTGVLVAVNGITGDAARRTAAWSIVERANGEGRRILVVTLDELAALADISALRSLLIHKVMLLTAGAHQI